MQSSALQGHGSSLSQQSHSVPTPAGTRGQTALTGDPCCPIPTEHQPPPALATAPRGARRHSRCHTTWVSDPRLGRLSPSALSPNHQHLRTLSAKFPLSVHKDIVQDHVFSSFLKEASHKALNNLQAEVRYPSCEKTHDVTEPSKGTIFTVAGDPKKYSEGSSLGKFYHTSQAPSFPWKAAAQTLALIHSGATTVDTVTQIHPDTPWLMAVLTAPSHTHQRFLLYHLKGLFSNLRAQTTY